MSARGSTAKISSLSSMSPPALASRVCTLTFILVFLAFVGFGLAGLDCLGLGLGFLGFGVDLGVLSFSSVRLGRGLLLLDVSGLLGGDGRDFFVTRKRWHLVDRGVVDQAGGRDFDIFRLHLLENARRIWRGVRPRQLDRVLHGQPAALVARNRALDEQKAADRVGADDFKVLLG